MSITNETSGTIRVVTGNDWLTFQREAEDALANGKLTEAAEYLSVALVVAQQFKSTDPRIILSLDLLSKIYVMQKDYARAIELVHKAVAAKSRLLGTFNHFVLADLTKLAELYKLLGHRIESEQYAKLAEGISLNGFRCITFNSTLKTARTKGSASITTPPAWAPVYPVHEIAIGPVGRRAAALSLVR
jgi:tetratricopeptide (TPR) repeat protein